MNIAKAFIERNRLKKYISSLSDKLRNTRVYHEEVLGERDWSDLDGETYDEVVDKILKAKAMLCELNKAIDSVNYSQARATLNDLELYKGQLATVDWTLNAIYSTNLKVSQYQDGKQFTVVSVLDVNKDKYLTLKKDLEKLINKTEDKLAEINETTKVDIPEDLVEYLGTYRD